MPELPEVETVLKTLELRIKGQRINDINVLWDNIIDQDIDEFKRLLINKKFTDFKRRGKYLLFELEDVTMISHLRMEGKYFIEDTNDEIRKHTHVIFKLDDFDLRYHDVRKFGKMEVIKIQDNYDIFKNLGPEPFSEDFNLAYVNQKLDRSKKTIKEELLNQNFVAGIGNIYADEICFRIKVLPTRSANSLTEEEKLDLIKYTKHILNGAIKAGGTTIRSYTSSLGVNGLFQLQLKVHTKYNEPCPVCETKIQKTKVGGRGTYYCENCQK